MQGLLRMALHPDYQANRHFCVSYTDTNGDSRVVRHRTSANPEVADPAWASETPFVSQPFADHNGGLVAFGEGKRTSMS